MQRGWKGVQQDVKGRMVVVVSAFGDVSDVSNNHRINLARNNETAYHAML